MGKSLARFLYGSQNYKLDTPESDRDYKVIIMPNARDFWCNDMLNKHIDEHESYWDYRHFTKKLIEMNPNALELLFSTEKLYFEDSFAELLDKFQRCYLHLLFRANFQNFYKGVFGMVHNTLKRTDTDPRKRCARVYYFYEMLQYLISHDFYMSEKAWRNSGYCASRIRSGEYDWHDYILTEEDFRKLEEHFPTFNKNAGAEALAGELFFKYFKKKVLSNE